jgi:hypothetical protein
MKIFDILAGQLSHVIQPEIYISLVNQHRAAASPTGSIAQQFLIARRRRVTNPVILTTDGGSPECD